jgi:hypothetical protein
VGSHKQSDWLCADFNFNPAKKALMLFVLGPGPHAGVVHHTEKSEPT